MKSCFEDTHQETRKAWIFWHLYRDRRTGSIEANPYKYRQQLMWRLCEKAAVHYFNYYALRHAGASIMCIISETIITIQWILAHEKITTTENYLHSIRATEKEAIMNYERARREIPHFSPTGNEKGPAIPANPLNLLVSPVGIEPTTY